MKYRALVFEDDESLRTMLSYLLDGQGYETVLFPHPAASTLFERERCTCADGEFCADVILVDHFMPTQNGLDFLAEQQRKGCKCMHMAVMSGGFDEEHIRQARALGIKVFHKPLSFKEISAWLKAGQGAVDPDRKLFQHDLHTSTQKQQFS